MYPLCIDRNDKSTEELQVFESSSAAIMCIEGGQRDANALNVVESNIGDSCYIPEMEKENYIYQIQIYQMWRRFNCTRIKLRLWL